MTDKSTVKINLLKKGAFLKIGDEYVYQQWAVTDEELLQLKEEIEKIEPELRERKQANERTTNENS